MNPLDFMVIAEEFKDSHDEAHRRTSVSRAYYALYNHVKHFFETKGIMAFSGRAEDHTELLNQLTGLGNHKAKTIAQNLRGLRNDRNDADYEMQTNRFNQNFTKLTYVKSKIILKEFDAVKSKLIS